MKKIFVLPLLAALALALASCANPSDSGSGVQESWPQVTPVNISADFEGFEELPKDVRYQSQTYGMNWVFVAKFDWDENESYFLSAPNYRLKPVEFHKSNKSGLEFLRQARLSTNGECLPDEGAYRCVIYRKKGLAAGGKNYQGCDCLWRPTGEKFRSETLLANAEPGSTETLNGELFRKYYKYAW